MKNITIRQENNNDIDDIRQVILAAFENHPHSNQTEHLLVDKLREAGALSISLVAEVDGKLVGHIAFSPVSIEGERSNWYGLAPVSAHPAYQRQGIGGMLIQAGLAELHKLEAAGCVLLGEPEYYGRFGFARVDGLTLAGVPPEYFLALPFSEENIQGEVAYHKAFEICG
jgi:putative acetyltransferase